MLKPLSACATIEDDFAMSLQSVHLISQQYIQVRNHPRTSHDNVTAPEKLSPSSKSVASIVDVVSYVCQSVQFLPKVAE